MGTEIYVSRHAGDQLLPIDEAVFDRVFGPHLDARRATVLFADGGGADVDVSDGAYCFSRPGGTDFFAALFSSAKEAGAIAYWHGSSPCGVVADEAALSQLLPDMVAVIGPVVVGDAETLLAVFDAS